MRRTPSNDELDQLLFEAAPDVAASDRDEFDRVWNRVSAGMTTDAAPRRGRRRTAVGLAVGAAVLATSSLAAADLFTAHTGKQAADSEDLRLGGPGERLDPAAPDYGSVVARTTADVPFPTRSARAFAVRDQVSDVKDVSPGTELVSVGAVRAWVADAAVCAWSNQWAAATRDGDQSARADAIRMIQQAPAWPAVTAIDPNPHNHTRTLEVTDADGVTRTRKFRDPSQFFYLAELGSSVEGTDPDAVAKLLAQNNGYCRPRLVPDLPQANPMYRQR